MATENWQTSSRLTLGFAIGFSVLGLLVTLAFATMLLTRVGRRAVSRPQMGAVSGSIRLSQDPSAPAPAMTPRSEPVPLSSESTFESSADQITESGNETTMTKTFPLVSGARFSINNINGSISVKAWDQPKAEVRLVKRSAERGAQVFFTNSANNLSLRTGDPNNNQSIRYEVKIPRNLARLDLKSVNGSIKLSDVTAQIFVESANGTIELNDVVGVSKIRTANGDIVATLAGASDGPMEVITANGEIDVTVKADFAAALDASSTHGSLNIDNRFGIPVNKETPGQHARGQIGSGGQPLKLTAINGSVKLSKQQ